MWASTTDDNAGYEQSDKRMCQLINIRGTSIKNDIFGDIVVLMGNMCLSKTIVLWWSSIRCMA